MNEARHFAEKADDGPHFLLFWRVFMDRIKMNHKMDKTFEEGFEEYVLDMKARNLRQGTIRH